MFDWSFLRYIGVFFLFYMATLLGGAFDVDVNRLNFILAVGLICYFNLFKLHKYYLVFIEISGILIALSFYFSSVVSVWLFGLLCIIGACLSEHRKNLLGKAIVFSATFFNLEFVSNVFYNKLQHDWLSCFNYIQYILENNFIFWNENPLLTRPSLSSYQPILHYLLAAVFYICGEECANFIGKGDIAHVVALEGVQVLTCFYIFCYYLIADKILKMFCFNQVSYLSSLAFLCFFPAYNSIAGFLNNDALLLPLQSGIIYWSLKFLKDDKYKYLRYVVIFSFLAAMTKLSGVIVLPMVLSCFLFKLFKERNFQTFYKLFLYGVMIILSISLWPIYQYFILGISYDYVPDISLESLAPYSIYEKYNLFSMFFYKDLFYYDGLKVWGINFWEALSKTALFGEWNYIFSHSDILWLMRFLTWLWRCVVLFFLFDVVYLLVREKKSKILWLSLILFCGIIGGEILFLMKHPFMCNQDFRYVAIVILPISLIFQLFFDKGHKILRLIGVILLGVFSFVSMLVWWNISF